MEFAPATQISAEATSATANPKPTPENTARSKLNNPVLPPGGGRQFVVPATATSPKATIQPVTKPLASVTVKKTITNPLVRWSASPVNVTLLEVSDRVVIV